VITAQATKGWSGRGEANPRHSAWEASYLARKINDLVGFWHSVCTEHLAILRGALSRFVTVCAKYAVVDSRIGFVMPTRRAATTPLLWDLGSAVIVHETGNICRRDGLKGVPRERGVVLADDTGNIRRRDDLKGALRLNNAASPLWSDIQCLPALQLRQLRTQVGTCHGLNSGSRRPSRSYGNIR
jgi:hypothetical protein